MAMSRKDYQAIAGAIAENYRTCKGFGEESAMLALRDVSVALAHQLAGSNPRFDRERFLDACYRNV